MESESSAPVTVKSMNQGLISCVMSHIILVQEGEFGVPTFEDLEFVGLLHILVEKALALYSQEKVQ